MDKNRAVRFTECWIGDIDSVIEFLKAAQKIGWNIYYVFNGHNLYSADISVDGAYQECFGMTKDEFEAELLKENREIYKRQGRKYIPKELWEDWEKAVDNDVDGLYQGSTIRDCLAVLRAIKDGVVTTKRDIENYLSKQRLSSGISLTIVKGMLSTLSEEYNKLPDDIENN